MRIPGRSQRQHAEMGAGGQERPETDEGKLTGVEEGHSSLLLGYRKHIH